MTGLIHADGLTKAYDAKTVVDALSLTVERGEVLGLLGPNGAGKSTTMKMLTGYLTPDSGAARIGGFDVQDSPIQAKQVFGYLPEGAPAYGDMRAGDYLAFIAAARGLKGSEAAEAVARAVASVDIQPVLTQTIDTLSKGFARRVGLAQAILHDPDVLILDEPTDGLDPNQKFEVRQLILAMAPRKAIIISTHILEEVDALCSRAIIIDHGTIVADGTPASLKERSPYHGHVVVRAADSEAETLGPALKAMAGIKTFNQRACPVAIGTTEFILSGTGTSLLSQVQALIAEGNWAIEDIRVAGGRLDDVFRALTTGDRSQGEEAAA
ncbi:MAG: ABC transporter ATP-binding protein [Pseudomonadota bacterium]